MADMHDTSAMQSLPPAVRVKTRKAKSTPTMSKSVPTPVENLEGDPPISTYAAAAAHWGLPMWAMVIPGTTRDMFEDLTKMKRVVQLMQDYLDCSDAQRGNIEGMSAGLAKLNRHHNTR
jgi:hypothetical protein